MNGLRGERGAGPICMREWGAAPTEQQKQICYYSCTAFLTHNGFAVMHDTASQDSTLSRRPPAHQACHATPVNSTAPPAQHLVGAATHRVGLLISGWSCMPWPWAAPWQVHASGPADTKMLWCAFLASMISTSTMQGQRFRYSRS